MVASNDRGPIAETYAELQALHILRAAREHATLPKASTASLIRAIFQAAEIALLNITDLLERATTDCDHGAFDRASVKLTWVRGFQHVLSLLSQIPQRMPATPHETHSQFELKIHDSPTFSAYFAALKHFDQRLFAAISAQQLHALDVLAEQSLEGGAFNLLHNIRISNHESTIWERNLAHVVVPTTYASYAALIMSDRLRDAVYDLQLTGDTFFTQFRGLHQIPEILCEEINDRIEVSIHATREQHFPEAAEQLAAANLLFPVVLDSMRVMVDSLALSDYHQIRENLGLTSGSHSLAFHHYLFKDLYKQMAQQVIETISEQIDHTHQASTIDQALQHLTARRFDSLSNWALYHILTECLQLRTNIDQWRNDHVQLPRNNLGGMATKSLTGSPDAVRAVKYMHHVARKHDPLQPLVEAIRGHLENIDEVGPLTTYLTQGGSLDEHLMELAGTITKERFPHVQERSGIFADRCPFVAPTQRRV